MKNDTKITPRLELILQTLALGPQKRLILQHKLAESGTPITRITLIRELDKLDSLGLIEISGAGKATTYSLKDFNPALADPSPTIDTIKEVGYNPQVISNLHDLFTPGELFDLYRVIPRISVIKEKLPVDIIRKEFERFCIELSWKSSTIEGNTYSLLETEQLLKSLRAVSGHTHRETQMILNHKLAFDTILQTPPPPGKLTTSYIRELHNILVQDLGVKTGFRQSPIGITGTSYVPLDNEWQIREAVDATISVINQTPDPFTQALIAVTMTSYIQPFSDGNKRTGRMLGNAILLGHDLLPLSYRSVSEIVYKDALIIFYEQNTLLPFKELFIDQLRFAGATYFRTH